MKKILLGIFFLSGMQVWGQVNPYQSPANQIQILQDAPEKKSNFAPNPVQGGTTLQMGSSITSTGQHVCKSHELNEAHFASLGVLSDYNQSYYQGTHNVNPASLDKTPGVNTISVIFHVVYNPNNPAENVSNALIMQVFNDLTEDFSLTNADAGNARPPFTPANPGINFCLATQDPMGNPLTEIGVVRVSTTEDWYNSDGGEENKMKSSATGGSQIWDRNKYLNVWICDISNGANSGTAGYAYRPTTAFLPSSSIDGIVLDYNLGMNNDNVLTHEVGHYLGLDHTWGGSGGCGNDDGFNDTPITDGPSFNYPGSCSGNQQTCSGTETQYENYMDYANCTCMFTQDQSDYMLTILQGIRSSLLISTGCDPTNTPPNSAFASIPNGPAPVIIPQNASVSFYDQSTNVPTAWNWVISGVQGTDWNYINSTNGSSQDPQVEFYNVGTYDVTLTASNPYGADPSPANETAYVQVVAPASGTACDTLRNWDPADADLNGYYTYLGQWGYSPGHAEFCGAPSNNCYGLQYAERLTYSGTAEVRRFAMPFFLADDNSGSGTIVLHVYDDNGPGGIPGTVLASETINIADINAGQWNEFDFTTPASVTGTFWAGFELFYGSPQDTVNIGMTDTRPGGNDSYYVDIAGFGWYDVSALGITGSIALDVMLSNGPDPVADFTATNDLACPGGIIDVNGSNSQNTTNYYWYLTDDPVTTVISSSTTPSNSYTFNTPGDYRIYLFADGSCKTDGIYLPVTVNPAVSATVNSTPTTCGNNNGTITVSGATGGDGTYYYSLDGQNYYASNTFNNLPSGTYTVYVATFGDNCEAVYPNIVVGGSTPFTATVSPNVSVCPGNSATIEAFGGASYAWYDGPNLIASTPSTIVTPATQTQYSCIVTNGSGCQSTVYTTVTVYTPPTAPVITPQGATTFCSGSDVDLQSSYATGNLWSNSQTGSTITVNSTGSYTVTHTDANGCSSTSAPISITVVTPPTITAGTITGPNACATATGSIQVNGTGSGDLSWSGTASGGQTGITLPYTIPNLGAGTYNIVFTNSTGCPSNTLNQGLNDPNPPTSPVITPSGATTFCNGGSVTLSSSYASGNSWSNSATTQDIIVTTSGTYSVTYTDGFNCSSSSAPIVVTVNNNPAAPTIAASGPVTFCDGGSVTLTSSQGTGNLWSTSESTSAITVTTSGSYTVTYTNANNCSTTSAPLVVTVNPLPAAPTISANGPTTFCDGGSVTLTASQSSGINWSTNETTQSITVSSDGTYSVTYTDGNNCESVSTSETVTVNPLPTVSFGALTNTCENYAPFTLTGGSPSGGTYSGTGVSGSDFDPSVGTGTYTITYTYTDANSCSNSTTSDITVDACLSVELINGYEINVYPNPFSTQLNISLEGEFTYELIDASGRIIEIGAAKDHSVLDVQKLDAGYYTLRVNSGNENKVVRLTKAN